MTFRYQIFIEKLASQLRYHFGPSVLLTSVTFAATESAVGVGYDPTNTNLYRLDSNEHIELLDIEKDRSPENLSQPVRISSLQFCEGSKFGPS